MWGWTTLTAFCNGTGEAMHGEMRCCQAGHHMQTPPVCLEAWESALEAFRIIRNNVTQREPTRATESQRGCKGGANGLSTLAGVVRGGNAGQGRSKRQLARLPGQVPRESVRIGNKARPFLDQRRATIGYGGRELWQHNSRSPVV